MTITKKTIKNKEPKINVTFNMHMHRIPQSNRYATMEYILQQYSAVYSTHIE